MFQFVLRRGGETAVPKSFLVKLDLFKRRPELAGAGRYTIQSDVDPDVFGVFMTRLYGAESEVGVTEENAERLRDLCDELGFSGFEDEIRAVLGDNSRLRKDMLGLRGRVTRHDVILEQLQRRVLELEHQLQVQRDVSERVEAVENRLEETHRELEEIRRNDVRDDIRQLKRDVSERATAADVRELSKEVSRLKEAEAKRPMAPIPLQAASPPEPKPTQPASRPLPHQAASSSPEPKPTQPASRPLPLQAASSSSEPKPAPLALPAPDATPTHTVPGKVPKLAGGEFVYDSARPLDGIIAHLTRECGGNVHKKGVVEVTASGFEIITSRPRNVVDFTSDFGFSSKDEENSWICYDFKERRVTPTSYSLRCHVGAAPKGWRFAVSNDGSEWDLVDDRWNVYDCRDKRVHNFQIGLRPSGSFRYVRILQTDKNHAGTDRLNISAFEIFGTLSSR